MGTCTCLTSREQKCGKTKFKAIDYCHNRAYSTNLKIFTRCQVNHAALCATRVALLAHGTLVAIGHPEAVLTPDCLGQVYGVTVVVTRHPVYGTPLVAPVFAPQQERSNDGEKPYDVL